MVAGVIVLNVNGCFTIFISDKNFLVCDEGASWFRINEVKEGCDSLFFEVVFKVVKEVFVIIGVKAIKEPLEVVFKTPTSDGSKVEGGFIRGVCFIFFDDFVFNNVI